jgi:hypothetical protein
MRGVPAGGTGRECARIRAVKVDIDGDALINEVLAARLKSVNGACGLGSL